jgi:hypothetical protein
VPESNNPFDELLQDFDPENLRHGLTRGESSEQPAWEGRCVLVLLTHFGAAHLVKELRNDNVRLSGRNELTFAAFRRSFPSFPCWLSFCRLPYLYKLGLPQLVKHFTSTPLWKGFLEQQDAIPEAHANEYFGVVFEWRGVWPMAIIHNNYQGNGLDDLAFVRTIPKREPPEVLAVQSFRGFLSSLHWHPGL